ncbi:MULTISPECIES: patatin-like phospholipase family protein [Oceanotoga]|uniref:patatin-like phospholipase family protein n=1 Tax=Oceanotoga TaxID=1255275 RepID=UPI00264AA998|nr:MULTISPECIES: patatin-like phospholipase family protein [Oceanotoga]MDN5342842.1 hypothetical protein [Oceanotoga sp.]MDO7977808.1 patatin-like phospholipase family protein [Oceanotoga teriensis]
MNNYGLVLSGGGAKGSYQIGVWKALSEMNIKISTITGTSIGALNGAFLIQEDYELLKLAWTHFSIDTVLSVDKEKWNNKKMYNKKYFSFLTVIKNLITSGGIETKPLEEILRKYIDEEKIRRSNIDFGINTYSLTDKKPIEIFKEDIPQGKFVDYLLASSCFPAFKPVEIDEKKYIDGGIHDNLPITMMENKGIKNIIVVDVGGKHTKKSKPLKDSNVIYIRSNRDLGKTLEIDSEKAKENIKFGYLDTLKAFNHLTGIKYYIVYDKKCQFIKNSLSKANIEQFFGINNNFPFLYKELLSKRFFNFIHKYCDSKKRKSNILSIVEITGNYFNLNSKRIYSVNLLNKKIINEYEKINEKDRIYKLINYEQDERKLKKYRREELINNPKMVIAAFYIDFLIKNKYYPC